MFHTHTKAAGKVTVLYILIFKTRWEDISV